jgi:malto-oligosyltrehalose synthase
MYNPLSTYRIQLNKEFCLNDLEEQVEYLSALGVGTIYASPVFEATPGSMHGYDITNPHRFNPEIMNQYEFLKVRKLLEKHKIGWLQDIVPNHMAYHMTNAWIMDVLEKGQLSDYYKVFDFEPGVASKENPLMVPFLGSPLEEAINNKEIKLGWENGNFTLDYFDNRFPVNFETFSKIIGEKIIDAPTLFEEHWENNLLDRKKADKKFLETTWEESRIHIMDLLKMDKQSRNFIDNLVLTYNANDHLIREVIGMQYYELCHWQDTEKRINYRRFFTVNGLICLRMEDEQVFSNYHRFVAEMVKEGLINGLRIDHIDGLNDPNQYLEKLRKLCGDGTYMVVEKILEHGEEFPLFWPVQGNTGYDFLAIVNNLFTSVRNYEKLKQVYNEVTSIDQSPEELIYKNKKMILTSRMHGEWDNVFSLFESLDFINFDKNTNVGREEMKEAIGEFMLACPVYRLYPKTYPLTGEDRVAVEKIFTIARERNPALEISLEIFSQILLVETTDNPQYNDKLKIFFARLMQYTGPLMAKGVEDTSMYQYNCLIAHNEVGDALNAGGITIKEFHRLMISRWEKWPYTMNTTSTHDTKRGEDVRARLNVISVLADEWEHNVRNWMTMNQKLKERLSTGLLEPSTSVEYFIYQTILGTFPFDGRADESYNQRIKDYMVKALREAKRKVSWRDPDDEYETAICNFVDKLLDAQHEFLDAFIPFMEKVSWRSVVNSLSQLVLKCTCPGVPDIYQGTEFWDLTLVDPDNRKPVDYEFRKKELKKLFNQYKENPRQLTRELTQNPLDGRMKLLLSSLLLNYRRKNPDLFLEGKYIPLETSGPLKNHLMAYCRQTNDQWLLVVVPLVTDTLSEKSRGEYLSELNWDGSGALLPDNAPNKWTNFITRERIVDKKMIEARDIFKNATVGIYIAEMDS